MDEQKREVLAVEVFKRTGVALSPDDPVFVLADICKELIKPDVEFYAGKQQAVLHSIREIPGALAESVEIIAKAVERAETISAELAESAVQKARAEATEAITNALSAHLSSANEGLTELERRLKLASSSLRDRSSLKLNRLLGGALLLSLLSLPISMLLHKAALDNAQNESAYYLREIAALERGIERLPPALQEKVKQGSGR